MASTTPHDQSQWEFSYDMEMDFGSEEHASIVYAALEVDKELQPDKPLCARSPLYLCVRHPSFASKGVDVVVAASKAGTSKGMGVVDLPHPLSLPYSHLAMSSPPSLVAIVACCHCRCRVLLLPLPPSSLVTVVVASCCCRCCCCIFLLPSSPLELSLLPSSSSRAVATAVASCCYVP
ncbi:hypothetical protein V8G54_022906 [Vigna mungo]|uniref:Uncharacterized protein n=1 Tax=Vigna mungo TaxID=3915 RepID=A0AAQ3N268_VIGMU